MRKKKGEKKVAALGLYHGREKPDRWVGAQEGEGFPRAPKGISYLR